MRRGFVLVQWVILAALILLEYFAQHKMGVQRHVMAQSFYWAKDYPLKALMTTGGVCLWCFSLVGWFCRHWWTPMVWGVAVSAFGLLGKGHFVAHTQIVLGGLILWALHLLYKSIWR